MRNCFLVLLGVILATGLVGGCFLNRQDQAEWDAIKDRMAQYAPQVESAIRDCIAGNIKPIQAAKQIETAFQNKFRDTQRQLELAEIRARNFWASMGVAWSILSGLIGWGATRYTWAGKLKTVIDSVDNAKDQIWPKATPSTVVPDRETFNQTLGGGVGKALGTWIDNYRKG